jgi:hypothetical protein
VLIGLALLLALISLYGVLNNRKAAQIDQPTAASSIDYIKMEKAGFVRFTDDGEAGVEVSARFKNTGTQRGVIGDFRIELQDAAGARLVQWTVLSAGEIIEAGETRTLTSVLFGPPKTLAQVRVTYPLGD